MIMLKIVLMILLKIDMVENFMIDNTEHIFTKVIIISLGKRQADTDEDHTKFLLKRIGYNILMFSTYFFAQAWQQAKWIDVRQRLKSADHVKINFCNRYNVYLDIYEKEKTEKEMQDAIIE